MTAATSAGARLVVPMPEGWERMPDPAGPDAAGWAERVARGSSSERLRAALEGALRTAAAQHDARRLRWVLVGPAPAHSLQAWASLDLVGREEAATVDAYDAAAREPRPAREGVRLWHREVSRRQVAGAPAVVLHDLLTVADEADAVPAVQQRALVALFPAEPVILVFEVSTPRLNAFGDIEAVAVAIADGIRWESE